MTPTITKFNTNTRYTNSKQLLYRFYRIYRYLENIEKFPAPHLKSSGDPLVGNPWDRPISKLFLVNIIEYNGSFAMTSIGNQDASLQGWNPSVRI